MHKTPKVSVIMNCFNGRDYLNLSVPSLLNQTYENWELIFWDNSSTDDSINHPVLDHPKIIKFSSERTLSLGEARNCALKETSGEWVAFLDVDDEWLPQKLSTQMAGVSNTSHILSYGGIHEITKTGQIIRSVLPRWSSGYRLSEQLEYFEINLVTSMVKKSILSDLDLQFRPDLQASEEYNLFLRLLVHGTVKVEAEVLGKYRVHDTSLTYNKIDRWALERRITLADLVELNADISGWTSYKLAKRQADYYEACYLMKIGKAREARGSLSPHVKSIIYFCLYLLTLSPRLWRGIHSPVVKKKLTDLLRLVK